MIKNISLSLALIFVPGPLSQSLHCIISTVTIDVVLYPQSSSLNHMLHLFPRHTHMLGYAEGFFLISRSFKIPFPVSDFSIFLTENENTGSVGCSESSSNLAYFKQIAFWKENPV